MNKSVLMAAVIGLAVLSPAPAIAKKKPQLSALALQQMQSREYDTNKSISFPAVVTILQDSGYRIQAADKDTGLITATASTKSKLTWMPFVGFGKSKKTPVVSAFIEERGRGSRIRLNFVMAKIKSNAYGMGMTDEEPIEDPATYRDAFERIDKEVFTRLALVIPASAPAPVPAPAEAASTTPAAAAAAPVVAPEAAPASTAAVQ